MSAVLLNGASSPVDPASALCTEVERQLAARFDTVRCFHLAGCDIDHCMGEFDCFVETPGRCRIHDEGQEIERAVHDADLVVLVTPLHYGGYAAQLKKALREAPPWHLRRVFVTAPLEGTGPACNTASLIPGARFLGFDDGGHLPVGLDEKAQAEVLRLLVTATRP